MRISILDASRNSADTGFREYLSKLEAHLRGQGHEVERLILDDLDVKQCLGCWGCWVKTPGECVLRDDGESVCRSVIRSDLTLLAAPLVMGFPTAILKRTMDRLIPLIHPYVTIDQGEIHHRARYKCYPKFALLTQRAESDTDEDLDIVTKVFSRMSLNFKSKLVFVKEASSPIEEVALAVAL